VWLALTPFLGLGQAGNLWDDLIVGTVVAIVGFWMKGDRSWQGWLAGLLGLWMIVAAFIPDLVAGAGLTWNNLVVGLVIAAAGFAALGGGAQAEDHSAHTHDHAHSH
jgi:SPW repeat-containing protein